MKRITAAFAVLACFGAVGCAKRIDPTTLHTAISTVTADFVEGLRARSATPGGDWWIAGEDLGEIQRGIVLCHDGYTAKYVFISHHQSKDGRSHALFDFDGHRRPFTGYFCCEVQFEEPQPSDRMGLEQILSQHDEG